jgi:hypothetical protein
MSRGHGFWSLKFVVSCVSSDICYGPITRLEELYRVCVCVSVRDIETSKGVCLCPIWVALPGKKFLKRRKVHR